MTRCKFFEERNFTRYFSAARCKHKTLSMCFLIFLLPSRVCFHSLLPPRLQSLSTAVCLSALSVSEACDWTAVMLISIMLQHPSSTCVKLRKTYCALCMCGHRIAAAVATEDRVKHRTKQIRDVGKCLISKYALGGGSLKVLTVILVHS